MTWAKAGRFVEFLRFDGLLAVRLDCRLFDKHFMYMGIFWIQIFNIPQQSSNRPLEHSPGDPLSQT